jgi:hypothetical protein
MKKVLGMLFFVATLSACAFAPVAKTDAEIEVSEDLKTIEMFYDGLEKINSNTWSVPTQEQKEEFEKTIIKELSRQECPKVSRFETGVVLDYFSKTVKGGGINQDWLYEDFFAKIMAQKGVISVRTWPVRKAMLTPDPSVGFRVETKHWYAYYVLSPNDYRKILCLFDAK